MEDDQKVHVEDKMDNLLEECWFYDNLLLRKTRHSSRSDTDTSEHAFSSSTSDQLETAPSVSEVYAEIIKQESLTVQEIRDEGVIADQKTRSVLLRANHGLNRAPSLPVNMGMELKESCKECIPPKASTSGLSRQTSLTPNLQTPRLGQVKGRISRTESLDLDAINEMRNGYMKCQKNTRKTSSALEYEDLGLKNEDINDIDRNPYLSEAWKLKRSSSSISNWVVRKSSEDMKAQLKSWARTVASNVR